MTGGGAGLTDVPVVEVGHGEQGRGHGRAFREARELRTDTRCGPRNNFAPLRRLAAVVTDRRRAPGRGGGGRLWLSRKQTQRFWGVRAEAELRSLRLWLRSDQGRTRPPLLRSALEMKSPNSKVDHGLNRKIAVATVESLLGNLPGSPATGTEPVCPGPTSRSKTTTTRQEPLAYHSTIEQSNRANHGLRSIVDVDVNRVSLQPAPLVGELASSDSHLARASSACTNMLAMLEPAAGRP